MNPTPLTRLYSREKRVREWFVDGVIFFVIAARVMRSSLGRLYDLLDDVRRTQDG